MNRAALCAILSVVVGGQLAGCGPVECAPDPIAEYYLPFTPGTTSLVVQGNHGGWSHRNEYSIDFMMPLHTPILAARDGVVIQADDTHTKTCWLTQDCPGNRVIIEHADGTRARYWHVYQGSIRVAKGAQVKRGEVIAEAGQTGIAFIPHLHFSVTDHNNKSIEVSFAEICGNRGVPLPMFSYRSQNATQPSQ